MNKDINKYKNKRILFKILTGIGLSLTAVGTVGFLMSVMNSVIPVTILISTGIISVGSAYVAEFASDKKKACDNTINQLELRKKLKNFTSEEKEILSNIVKSNNDNHKNSTINNISIKDNIELIKERFNLLRDASLSDNILSLVEEDSFKYGNISNLEAALTTEDNIPADVIYKTESLKVKQKKKNR